MTATGVMYLVVICDTAIRCGSHDFRCRGSQVTWTHDTRFGNTEAQYQVIPPQRHIAIGWTRRAGLFGVNGTAVGGRGRERGSKIISTGDMNVYSLN